MRRKALISPGFGAGWSTWASNEYREDMLFDPGLIAAVENREPGEVLFEDHPAVQDFLKRMGEKHGPDAECGIYCGGLRDIEVREIHGRFRVEEYDGSESVITRDDDEGWV